MPFNMNTVDTGGGAIDDNHGYDTTMHAHDPAYRHQWAPTHLPRSSSSKQDSADTVTRVIENADALYSDMRLKPSEGCSRAPHISPLTLLPYQGVRVDSCEFDHQEKVSVRLVENRGLVMEEPDNESIRGETSPGIGNLNVISSYDFLRPYVNGITPTVNCLQNGTRTACRGHSSKISPPNNTASRLSPSSRPDEEQDFEGACGCREQRQGSPTSLSGKHFSRTRLGSSSPGGVSSMTPLMSAGDPHLKENHKIPVIVKPSSMMKHSRNNIHLYCALVLGFSASLFFSLTLLLARILQNRDHHPTSIAFWRYLGILVPSVPLGIFYVCRGKKKKVLGAIWPIRDMDKAANALALLMRGVLGSTAVILRFCSLKYLTIGDSSVISYCAPVFAAIFSPLCMKKDKGGVIPVLLGGMAALGIFLVCQPPFLGSGGYNSETLKGVFIAFLSMMCSSGVLIIVRNLLRQKVHFSLMMFVLGTWGVFEAGVLACSLDVLKVPELLPDIVMMFGVAILTFFGQLFVLLALRIIGQGQGSAVAVMRSCDILLCFLWQYLFLKTEPEITSILGAILIILAVWCVCFRKWLITLRENDTMRQRLALMLY